MNYFILEVHKEYTPPNLNDWFGRLDKKTLSGKEHFELSKCMVFTVNDTMQTVFTDIIMHPYFMISRDMKKVMEMYEPFILFRRIILFNKNDRRGKDYHIPFLEEVDCLTSGSQFNLDKSVIHYAQVDGTILKGKAIVRVANINHSCILIREDFAESLLCRKFVGIGLRETEMI